MMTQFKRIFLAVIFCLVSLFSKENLNIQIVSIDTMNINLKVINNEKENITFQYISVKKFEQDQWVSVRGAITCPCKAKCQKRIFKLKPKESLTFIWNKKDDQCREMAGTFKFEIPKYKDQARIIAASGAFTVKKDLNKGDFGPLMGHPIIKKMPVPGKYTSAFHFSINKIYNRESTLHRAIEGSASIELSNKNTVDTCFIVKSDEIRSRGKYISEDGKYHYTGRHSDLHMKATGYWSKNSNNSIHIKLTKSQYDSCKDLNETNSFKIDIDLTCINIMKNDRLPVNTLACKLKNTDDSLSMLSVNPDDSPRAGPYVFQKLGNKPYVYDTGESWLLFGSKSGLKIMSTDERRTCTPILTFSHR